MKYNPNIHHRKSIRLKGYDYSKNGAYFITICIYNSECLLGKVVDGEMILSEYGEIVRNEWLKREEIRKNVQLDNYVVMPNHFHSIIVICRGVLQYAPTKPIQITIKNNWRHCPWFQIRCHKRDQQIKQNSRNSCTAAKLL